MMKEIYQTSFEISNFIASLQIKVSQGALYNWIIQKIFILQIFMAVPYIPGLFRPLLVSL